MNEKHPLETTETQVDRPPRLRVDTAGLSEETRRELGLVEFATAEPIPPTGREGGRTSHRDTAGRQALGEGWQTVNTKEVSRATPGLPEAEVRAALPARAFPEEKQRAGSEARRQDGSNPNGWEHHPALARETNEGRRQNKEVPFGRPHDFDTSPVAGNQSVENQVPEEEGRQWAQGDEEDKEEGSPGAEQRREVKEPQGGGESFGEGNNPILAGGSMLPRPGRARSGAVVGRPDAVAAFGRELPPVGMGRSATDTREENERWQELQGAVKQNLAHHQQTHAAMLQALRDSARLHTAQRAELDRLAAQVKMLLGQSENAGFNRQ